MKIAALYARVSSQKQKEGETIESQLDSLREYAGKHGYVIPAGFEFKDEGYTGSMLERPGLDALRDAIHDNMVDVIMILSPDRLSRKYAYQLFLQDEFEKKKIEVIFIKSPKPKTAEDQFALHFQGVFAEYERAQIMERCRRGRLYKAKQGDPSVLPKIPFGYKRFKDGLKTQIEIVEDQAMIIKEIFNLYTVHGVSIRYICKHLENKGILTPTNKTKWATKTITGFLKNPAYIGMGGYGKTEKAESGASKIVHYKSGRIKTARQPKKHKSKDTWYSIPFPRFIENDQFELAQELLKTNQVLSKRNSKEVSLLQGMIICESCGGVFWKKIRKSGKLKIGYYCCRNRLLKNAPKCNSFSVQTKHIDNLVWNNVFEMLKAPHLIEEEILRRVNHSPDIVKAKSEKAEIERGLARLKTAQDKLLNAYQNSDCLTLDELKKRMKNLSEQVKSLETSLKAIEAYELNSSSNIDIKEALKWFQDRLEESSNKISTTEKRKIIRMLIDEIVVGNNSVKIKHCIPLNLNSRKNSLLCVSNSI